MTRLSCARALALLCAAILVSPAVQAAAAPAPRAPAQRTPARPAQRAPARPAQRPQPAVPAPLLGSAEFGWISGSTDFRPPGSGPGPVTNDKSHPYVPNNTNEQPSFRIADVINPILKPWAAEEMKRANEEVLEGRVPFTPRSRCWPAGVPAFMIFSGVRPVYFLQTPKQVIMIHEGNQEIRRIYMNVPHSAKVKPSWYGESVGHYEGGDTLVVDTVGLSAKSYVDNYRTPHTNQLHVVERWKLGGDGRTLEVSFEVDDPGTFNMTWSGMQTFRRADEGPMVETICAESNANYSGQEVYPIPTAEKPDF